MIDCRSSVPKWSMLVLLLAAGELGGAGAARAALSDLDPESARGQAATACLRAIQKESAQYHAALLKLVEACKRPIVRGGTGELANCSPLPAELELKRVRARDRLRLKIARACGGGNDRCDAADTGADTDVPLADVNWSLPDCPALHGHACGGGPPTDCADVTDCLLCQIDHATEAALDTLVADRFDPALFGAGAEPARTRNRCQQAILKESRKFAAAKAKILRVCWDKKLRRASSFAEASPCPDADTTGATAARIADLERKLAGRLCKRCGGGGDADGDGRCDVNASDLAFLATGLSCPGVATVPASAGHRYPSACRSIGTAPGGEIAALQEYVDCVTCALEAATDCLGFLANGNDDALGLDYPSACTFQVPPACGNGQRDPGEACDGSAAAPDDACPAANPCSATCTCPCPARVEVAADASDPETRIDAGWTGLVHEAPFIANAKLTLAVSACDDGDGADFERDPRCGVCALNGPVPNAAAGAGDVANRRCTGDPASPCTTDLDCAGTGACAFFVGAPLPFTLPAAACGCGIGGCVCFQSLGSCVLSHLAEPMTGSFDVETGAMALAATVLSRVTLPDDLEAPCPICDGDGTANDGIRAGTCTGGSRAGEVCDAHGTSPIAPFGSTSFDCPVHAASLTTAVTHRSRLLLATTGGSATLTAAGPACSAFGFSGYRCACDTCADADATPCMDDADCALGDTCGGNRCLGGPNHGLGCTIPGLGDPACAGAPCGVVGQATQPNACLDTTCVSVGSGRGECTNGPWDLVCGPVETYRQCAADSDCPLAGDGCRARARPCFLDNGLVGGTIAAEGMADPPTGDVASPLLAGVTCPSIGGAYDAAAMGLPGAMRVTMRTLVGGLADP